MSDRPTPETDAAIKASNGQWSFVLRDTCERLERKLNEAREALTRIADCDWVITLPDRMDAVRKIAREALNNATND